MRQHSAQALAMGIVLAALMLAACGTTGTVAGHSPTASPAGSPTSSATPTPSPAAYPSPNAVDIRLVIDDFTGKQVRLARLNATDTAKISGLYDGIVADHAIVLNGSLLQALSRTGVVTTLGRLAAVPDWAGAGTVVLSPDSSQWLYAITDNSWTAQIHLGSLTSDRVIATLPSPNGNAFYRPFAWNASGVYMIRQATGIGGAGPFLEYHMPLAKFDMTRDQVADVSPQCFAYQVFDDGTMICGQPAQGKIEVRSPSGADDVIQLASGGEGSNLSISRIAISPDHKRLVAARNGAKDPVINYQMAVGDLTLTGAQDFGPLDYFPDTWLPDGRVVAEHQCIDVQSGGGPCNASVDGTYFFSADGTSRTLFFKLAHGSVVGYL